TGLDRDTSPRHNGAVAPRSRRVETSAAGREGPATTREGRRVWDPAPLSPPARPCARKTETPRSPPPSGRSLSFRRSGVGRPCATLRVVRPARRNPGTRSVQDRIPTGTVGTG